MKKSCTIYISILLILFQFSCSEDKIEDSGYGTIQGTVVEAVTYEPLVNARISTQPISNTVFTDEFGEFTLENVPLGEYSVQAKKDDYIAGFEPATVNSDFPVSVVFELELSTANNNPPSAPVLLSPQENEVVDGIEVEFSWSSTDEENDALVYTLEIRNELDETIEYFENLADTAYVYSSLQLGVKYFWQVSVTDSINEPVLSPIGVFEVTDNPMGYRYLFTRTINENNVIFSADEEGNTFQLTSQTLNSFKPRRNVQANKIAFMQSNGAQTDIYTMNRDGSEKTKITLSVQPNGFNLNEIGICWPPNSEYIYFPSFDKLYRIKSNGQALELLYQTDDGSFISEVDVNESYNVIALKTNNVNGYNIKIFTIDFSGQLLHTVLSNVSGAASGLNLSVTTQNLVYSYDVSGFESPDYRQLDSRVFVYNFPAESIVDISSEKPDGTNDYQPMYAPNEASIIFTHTSNDGLSQRDVYTVPISDLSDRAELFTNAFMPDWK